MYYIKLLLTKIAFVILNSVETVKKIKKKYEFTFLIISFSPIKSMNQSDVSDMQPIPGSNRKEFRSSLLP